MNAGSTITKTSWRIHWNTKSQSSGLVLEMQKQEVLTPVNPLSASVWWYSVFSLSSVHSWDTSAEWQIHRWDNWTLYFYDYALIYMQHSSFSLSWLLCMIAPSECVCVCVCLCVWCVCVCVCVCVSVCVCVCFMKAILTRGGCRKCPWQVMTAYEDSDCVLEIVCLQSFKKSFSVLLNAASVLCVYVCVCVCVCTRWGPTVCISIPTCQHCGVKMTFCQMRQWAPAGLRATVRHSESLASCGSLCERLSGKSETLVILSWEEEECCCSRVVPRSCRFFCILEAACLLWFVF